MRLAFTILMSFTYAAKAATGYYVSSSTGSDANAGTQAQPFATIAKANSVVVSYDTVHLLRADIWNEQVIPPTDHLTYNYYGTGLPPLVTAFKPLTGWTNSGNVWSATATQSVARQNTVLINGQISTKARYPNTGYLIANSIVSTTQIAIPHTATDYTGTELVSTPQVWVIDVSKVLGKSNGATADTLTIDNTRDAGFLNLYYFYQNRNDLLDTPNEFTYNETTKVISVFSASEPTDVQYSIFDTLVNLHKRSNIVFDGISFYGGNTITFFTDSSRYDTLKSCSINNSGLGIYANAVRGLACVSTYIQNSLSGGYWVGNDTSLYMGYNYINKSGLLPGMGANGYSYYGGGFSYSNSGGGGIFRGNVIKNSGYHGLRFVGVNSLVEYNIVDTFCLTKNDGGGIYTFSGTGGGYLNIGSVIRRNIIKNGIGTPYGRYAVGVYLDDAVEGVTVDGNTLYNAGTIAGVQSKGLNNAFTNNIIWDSLSINAAPNTSNLTFKNNILYNSNVSGLMFQIDNNYTNGTIDSNYYLMPVAPGRSFKTTGFTNLDGWRSYFPNYDAHSKDASQLPLGITSSTPILVTNTNPTARNVSISGGYYDVYGNGYENSIYLQSFQSALLFPSKYKKPTPILNLRFRY